MQTNAALALASFALATIAGAVPGGPRSHTVFSAGQIPREHSKNFPSRTPNVFFKPNNGTSAVEEGCPLNEALNLDWEEASGKWKQFATSARLCMDINVHEDNATALEFDIMHGNTTEFGQIMSKDSDNGAYLWYGSKKSEPERVFTVAAIDTDRKYFILNSCEGGHAPQYILVHVYVREGAITATLEEQMKEDLRANDEKITSPQKVYRCEAPAQPEQ